MKQSLRKFISSMLAVSTALVLSGIGMVSTASAGQIYEASLTLGDARGAANTTHSFSFRAASTNTLTKISFKYTNTASGGDTKPLNLNTTHEDVTLASYNIGGATSGWTLNKTVDGTLSVENAGGTAVNSATVLTVVFSGVANNITTGAGMCDAVVDSDSCWVRISTFVDADVKDTTTITYTVINPITVTATVDPILTFTVAGVTGAQLAANDSYAGSGTTVDTTSTSIPFGNLTVGTPKVGQQSLKVLTNSNNGYNVHHKFADRSAGDVMTGTYLANNIDTFKGSAGDASWAAPKAFVAPTGLAKNDDSAWLGIRTSDYRGGAGPNFNNANVYAPPVANDSTTLGTNIVMTNDGPDNGTAPTFVTLKIEANAFQPSDYYTGTMVYNVVAKY